MDEQVQEEPQAQEELEDIAKLLSDLYNKIHLLSLDRIQLIKQINSLFIRLDVLSEVTDQLSKHLKVESEEYLKIVQKSVQKVTDEWKIKSTPQIES